MFARTRAHVYFTVGRVASFEGRLLRLLAAVVAGVAGFTSMVAFADDVGFKTSIYERNPSLTLRRFGALAAVPEPRVIALPYAKNLQLAPQAVLPPCAQTVPATCRAQITTIQFELTPLRDALPETATFKPKSVTIRHRMVVVAYSFK